jgi:hypothetical protein
MTQNYNLSQLANRVNTSGQIDLGTAVTGTLPASQLPTVPVGNGGTGVTTLALNNVLIGNNTSPVTTIAPGTSGNVLQSNGTAWVSQSFTFPNPVVNTITGSTNQVIASGSSGNVVLSLPQQIGIANNVQHGSLGIGTAASGTTGEIRATGNITAFYSDDRLKTKLNLLTDALDKICTLSAFYYEPNEIAQSMGYKKEKHIGLSAQQVQAVFPEVVAPAPIDEHYLTIRYEALVPVLVKAIKELRQDLNDHIAKSQRE